MKSTRYSILMIIVLFLVNIDCRAIDPSIYWGTWEGNGNKVKMNLMIEDTKITVRIDGKKLERVKWCFPYGELKEGPHSTIPFLYIHARESTCVYHEIYLILGDDGILKESDEYKILRGFYECGVVVDDQYGTTKSTSYPIELRRKKR